MRSFTRREVVGALVTLPATSLFKVLGAEVAVPVRMAGENSITTLNVVLHGLFAFVVWSNLKYIQAIAPIVTDHSYFAGGKSLASLKSLKQGQIYTLGGVKANQTLTNGFDVRKNSIFENIHDTDFRQAYCQILLPFPDAVYPLRVVPKQSGCEFYKTAPKLKQNTDFLPLIHVFSYTLASTHKPTIVPLSGLVLDQTTTSYNLHLRAEPKVESVGAPVAFDSLNLLFPELKAQLSSCYDNYYAPADTSFPSGLS